MTSTKNGRDSSELVCLPLFTVSAPKKARSFPNVDAHLYCNIYLIINTDGVLKEQLASALSDQIYRFRVIVFSFASKNAVEV